MFDISSKFETLREAKAEAKVKISKNVIELIKNNKVPKGNVIEVARTAGILAAKRVSEIIPLCHNIPLDYVDVNIEFENDGLLLKSTARSVWKTGVEIEALMAVTIAALTVYDMVKPLEENIIISEIKLAEKKGGKSQYIIKYEKPLRAGILVISDSAAAGSREDRSGKLISEMIKEYNVDVVYYKILPDEEELIYREIVKLSDEEKLDLVITTGGTGLGPRDVTPEATRKAIDKEVPQIITAAMIYGQRRTPLAMLSRAIAGVRKNTLIINFPGSPKAVKEYMEALFPGVLHAFQMLEGGGH